MVHSWFHTLVEGGSVAAMPRKPDPFSGPPVEEVPLASAPLERVIAQVRYPLVLAVDRSESIAPFQEQLRARYPLLEEERHQVPVPQQEGATQVIWRFASVDGAWRVSLSRAFVAIETTTYTSRDEFLSRFREVVGALEAHVAPARIDRLGVRYIDRIRGAQMADLARLVRDELRGIASAAVAGRCVHSLTESVFELDHARLLARWGLLPPNAVIDPSMEPVNDRTWVLDLDMASTRPMPFDVEVTTETARRFASQIYEFFRWAVTDAFLEQFGASHAE
jgi:uncharacterized protein (TIGR04255 family)